MEAVNGVSDVDKGDPPAPSPLTGCYLLIVIGEPHSQEHKDIILRRIAKGLLSWDASDCYVDLEKELAIINEQAPEGEDARYGERLIQFASENLVTEILIHPAISTLSQCMKNLLSSFTRHRHIIHSGYTFAANGSWILQDGTFSLSDFSEAFQEIEVQRIIRAYDNSISLDIHCSPEGDWTRLPKESFTKNCKVRINPDDVLTSGSPPIVNFLNYISPFLIPTDIETLLESSDVVGNIRFSHPTLYVFPGGQGDAALFGINGFNMLVDGGFARKACFWDFVRHLDRLDAVLLTRLNNSNVNGISSILRRKKFNTVYPQIGHFFCNIQERKAILSPDGDKDKDPLLISLLEEGQELINNLRQLNLQPQVCYRDVEPINLYHKVGHGTLDMYVISPARDSKEVKEFLQKWNNNDQRLFANQRSGKDFAFPIQNLISICALLVWQPASASDNITRLLFPGSTPQHKIFEGLDRLKQLECIKYPSCSAKTLAPNIKPKQTKTEKFIQEQKDFKPKLEGKIKEEIIKNGHANGFVTDNIITNKIKKHDSTESEKSGPKSLDIKKIEDKKETEKSTEEKTKLKAKMDQKPKIDPRGLKHSRSIERKPRSIADKKPSPTTPKKAIDAKTNGDVPKTRAKTSPTTTPAKSTKEANNRKVVESKYKTPNKKEASKVEKRDMKERRPVTRKPAESSPSRKVFESPVRKLPDLAKLESRKAKIEKEGTTDSSTVSTPSADADASLKKDISKLTPEELEQLKARELAELKEEQEVVNEIEAVFRKSEKKVASDSDLRKVKSISMDDKTEGEEYLIVEKEVIDQDSLDEKEVKECETQKHLRDSEESEKQRKMSDEAIEIKEAVETKLQEEKTPPTADIAKVVEAKEVPKESSAVSPDEKIDVSSGKKVDRDQDDDNRENLIESQPDEKHSTPIESGATTAPTLPEDERIPLDEIKEDNGDQVIVEKYVKEETKEKEIPVVQLPPAPTETVNKLPTIVGIRLDKQTPIRDLVKTPDEVADLPVHEVVDNDNYEQYQTQNEHLGVTKSQPKETKSSEEPAGDKNETLVIEENDAVEKSDTVKETVHTEVIEDTVTKVSTEFVEKVTHVEKTEEIETKVTTEIVEETKVETGEEQTDDIKEEIQVDDTQKRDSIKGTDDEEIKESETGEIVNKVTETIEEVKLDVVEADFSKETKQETETVLETTTHVISEVVTESKVEEKTEKEIGIKEEKTLEKEAVEEEKQEDVKKGEIIEKEEAAEKQNVEITEKYSEVVTNELEKVTETTEEIVHKTKETTETITATEEMEEKVDMTVVTTTEKIESHTEEIRKETEIEKPEEEKHELINEKDSEDQNKEVTTTEGTETVEKHTKIEVEETVTKSDSPTKTDQVVKEDEEKKEIKTEKVVEETEIKETVKTETITDTKESVELHLEKGDIEKEASEDVVDHVKEKLTEAEPPQKDTRSSTPEKQTEESHETKVKLPEEAKIADSQFEEGLIKDIEESLEDAKTVVDVTETVVTKKTVVEKSIEQELFEANKDIEGQKETSKEIETAIEEKTEEAITHGEEKVEQVINKLDEKVEEVTLKVEAKVTDTVTKVEETVTETVTKLQDKVVEVQSTVEDKVVEVQSKAEEKVKQAATKIEEKVEEIESKAEEAKKVANKVEEKIEETVTETVTKVESKVEESKTEIKEKLEEKVTESVTKVEETVKDVKSKVEESTATVAEVKEKLEETVVESVTAVEDKVTDVKSKVEESTAEVKTKIEEKVSKAVAKVEEKVEDVKTKVEESVEKVKAKIEEKVSESVEEKVKDVKSKVQESTAVVAEVKEKVEEKIVEGVAKVEEKVEDAKSKVQESIAAVADVKETVEETVTETVSKVEEKIQETVTKVEEKTEEVKSKVEEQVSAIEETLKRSATDVKEKADGAVHKVEEKVTETVTKAEDKVKEVTEKVENKLEETAEKAEKAVKDTETKLAEKKKEIEEILKEIPKAVEDKSKDVISKVEENIGKISPESLFSKKLQDDTVPEAITKKEAHLVEAVTSQKEKTIGSPPEDKQIVPPSEDILHAIEAQVIGATSASKEEKDKPVVEMKQETTIEKEIKAITENLEEFSKINIDLQSSEKAHKDEKEKVVDEIGKISAKPLELLEDKIRDLEPLEIKPIKIDIVEANLVDASEKDISEEKIVITSVLEGAKEIEKIDKKLQELKEANDVEAQNKIELDLVDKMELGRKSPKEREQDVAIIVASVAEVLKSDAPLEEFEGKIPLEIVFDPYPPYSTELRETHITTVDSPLCDKNVSDNLQMRAIEEEANKDPLTAFLNEERKVSPIHSSDGESRATNLIKDSTELIHATSKIISEIKQTSKSEDFIIIEDSRDTVLPAIIEKPLEETLVDLKDSDPLFEFCRKQSTTSSTEEQVSEDDEKLEKIEKVFASKETNDSDLHDEKYNKEESEKSIKLEKEHTKPSDPEETVAQQLVKSLTETTITLQKDLETAILGKEEKSTPEPQTKDTLDVGPKSSGKSTPEASDTINGTTTPAKSPVLSRASTPSIVVMDDKDDKEIILHSAQPEQFEDDTTTVVELKKDEVKNILELTKEFISTEQISHCISEKGDNDTTKIDNKASSSSSTKDDISRSKSPEEINVSRKSTPDIADVIKTEKLIESLTGKTTPPTVPASPISKAHTETLQEQMSEVTNLKSNDVRSSTPASDDCDISSGQVSRVLTTKEDSEKDSSDEEDLPGSPLSAMSQVAHSTSSQYDVEDSVHFVPPIDPMSTSFYGTLPDETEIKSSEIDFNKALADHKQTRGEDLVPSGSPSHVYEVTTAKYSSIKVKEGEGSQPQENLMTSSFIGTELPKDNKEDPIASWGKPLGLPSPAPINDNKGTPKKERKVPSNVIAKNKLNEDKKSLDSKYDRKGKKIVPVYMDLTYVPHHGNANYSYVDFFKRVRARYYVFSGIEPSKEVYNALLEAKQTWEEKDLEVTIISTYDTDVLGYWVAENEDLLTKCKIDLSPSASRCTINLQDHETSCSAYRLEFS